jgi:Mg2+ and Co2+ transporter CorA
MSHSHSSSRSTATEVFPDASLGDDHLSPPSPVVTTTVSAPSALEVPPGTQQGPHVRYALNVNTNAMPQSAGTGAASHLSPASPSPGHFRRRNTRANTFRSFEEFDEFDAGHPGWRPGAEPGIDPLKPDGGHPGSVPDLHADCQITVVDFSQASWVKCRWINVNGMSWDVIQALGKHKDLHRLAIEDIMNTRNRTKVDWYSNHAFLILTCQKLVRLVNNDSSDSDSSDSEDFERDRQSTKSHGSMKSVPKKMKRWFTGKKSQHPTTASVLESGTRTGTLASGHHFTHKPTGMSEAFNPNALCTLQRYHASSNNARTDFMERNSALTARGLAVMAEQVAIFITSDNTVIAFFEQSADDVEEPILNRLRSPTTIMRQSCDASMVAQAIIDAIIDMAIPVTACYADVIGDLELEVLLRPNIKHTKNLYIMISEVNKMFSLVNPIQAVINALRDHKTNLAGDDVAKNLQNPLHGVIISPMTYTYLSDVYDHCVLITENLNQIKESANHMIDLIFNTIATVQNESIKQLTGFTIIFLPLTFITGFFGQNFDPFPALDMGINYL